MTFTAVQMVALALASAAAGAVNSVAGGGTLLTFPTLIWLGLNPVLANASSNVGLLIGFVASVGGYRREVAEVRNWLPRVLPASVAGGLVGALLLVVTPPVTFEHLAPFLVLLATVLFMANAPLKRVMAGIHSEGHAAAFFAVQFVISTYGGYFGAGVGILMLAWLSTLHGATIHQANALKTLSAGVINCVASAVFVAKGLVVWPAVAVMLVGSLVGGFFGADLARRLGQPTVRRLVIGVGLVSAVSLALH